VLIGPQLRAVADGLSDTRASDARRLCPGGTVVVAPGLVWFFTVPYLIRAIDRRARSAGARRV
jgi:hypothetical protein